MSTTPKEPTRYLLCPKMLRAAMRANSISQSALGRIIGVSQASINYLLQAPRDPSIEHALAIARTLGVELEALVVEVPGEAGDLPMSRAIALAKEKGCHLRELSSRK